MSPGKVWSAMGRICLVQTTTCKPGWRRCREDGSRSNVLIGLNSTNIVGYTTLLVMRWLFSPRIYKTIGAKKQESRGVLKDKALGGRRIREPSTHLLGDLGVNQPVYGQN